MQYGITKKLLAEFLGTFWLVFGGCGSAVISAAFPQLGIGFVGVAFAFGLTVLTGAYAFGPISGGHFNPAVSLGLAAAGRFSFKELGPYVIVQVLGATAAAGVLYLIAVGNVDFSLAGGFAANGYDEHSPAGYTLRSGFIIEIVLTGFFLLVILGSTESRVPAGFAPIAIGLALTLIHLISIPVDKHLSQSCPFHRTGAVRRRLGVGAALGFLGRPACRRLDRRHPAPAGACGEVDQTKAWAELALGLARLA